MSEAETVSGSESAGREEALPAPSVLSNISLSRVALYALVFSVIQLIYYPVAGTLITVESAVLASVGGVGAAWLLAVACTSLQLSKLNKIALLWPAIFVVQMFADLIEGAVFTTAISSASLFLGGTVIAALVTLGESAAGAFAFPSSSSPRSIRVSLRTYFCGRSWGSWTARLVAGSIAYFPVYFLFGAIVGPFVLHHYDDVSNGLGLVVPGFNVMIPVELARGLLFAAVLMPLAALMWQTKKGTFLFLSLSLFILGAYVPFVAGTSLPWALKALHGVEILADSLAFGAILTYLFTRR